MTPAQLDALLTMHERASSGKPAKQTGSGSDLLNLAGKR